MKFHQGAARHGSAPRGQSLRCFGLRAGGSCRDGAGRRAPRRRGFAPHPRRARYPDVLRDAREPPAPVRPRRLRAGHGVRLRHLLPAEERARPQVDARDLRAHLRDVQDVPVTQGKFIGLLEALHRHHHRRLLRRPQAASPSATVVIILLFSLLGIAGSYGVAWFGIRVNTFANSRTAFAALRGKPFPVYAIPLKAGMSIGMLLISGRARSSCSASCFHPASTTPARASSASPSASRSAPRPSASRAASSRRSPTSART